jgi:hypothetical protein
MRSELHTSRSPERKISPQATWRFAYLLGWLVLGAMLAAGRGAHATAETFCVGSSFALGSALVTTDEGQSVDLDIRIRQGTYSITSTQTDFPSHVTISGGYTDVDCTVRNANPYNTVIDMGGGALTLRQLKGLSRAAITIDGVTIRNATQVALTTGARHNFNNDPGDLTIRRTRFTGLSGTAGKDPLELTVYSGFGRLENVLVDHITNDSFPYCSLTEGLDGTAAQFDMNFVTADIDGPACLYGGGSNLTTNYYYVSNSIFWNSGPGGLPSLYISNGNSSSNVYGQFQYTLVNYAQDQDGNKQDVYGGIAADPKWLDPANGSYDLGPGSPALDAVAQIGQLGLPSNDMIGQSRDLGQHPDMGALESNGSTAPTYIVGNTNDHDGGSLRQAILDANANTKDRGDIIFQLPGTCPQVITLDSPLPSITSSVRILGYSQAGSAPNADPYYFYPTLCVLLKPSSGTLASALRVPATATAGALDVSGVGFGGFSQPIMLLGGTSHRITGNQFGGNSGATALPGADLNAITVGMGSTGSFVIGGPSPGERNMISGAAESGVQIQSSVQMDNVRCQVVNNIIGANQDFTVAVPNTWGINLSGSNCLVQDNRIVGNSGDAIWINSGQSNTVRRNVIGLGHDGGPLGFNNGWGVRVSGSHNVIGSPGEASYLSGTLDANRIAYMLKGGIAVASVVNPFDNAIRDNLIGNNGIDGHAPAIDLGADGNTANDAGDGDGGPNQLQNYPTVSAIKYTYGYPASGSQDVFAYVFGDLKGAPGVYNIDAYFYDGSCLPGQRGQAFAYLGSWSAVIAGGSNEAHFNYQVQLPNVQSNTAVAFTATDANGNTSELGECSPVSKAVLLDDIFKNGFE